MCGSIGVSGESWSVTGYEMIMITLVWWPEEGRKLVGDEPKWWLWKGANVRYKGRKAMFFILTFIEWSRFFHMERSEPSRNSWA